MFNEDMRAFLVVLDSAGIGAAPDAAAYDDLGSNTLANLARAAGGINLPCMERLGLGNIPPLIPGGKPIQGISPNPEACGAWGALMEASQGKDTTTGHWEMMGIELTEGFQLFPHDHPSFPPELTGAIRKAFGRDILANRAASGTQIIQELGEEHMKTGALIIYTSADSVLQVAAHEEIINIDELYSICAGIRSIANPYRIGRIIARPFTGIPGSFKRTENRRDFSYPLPEPTLMDKLKEAGVHVVTVGKLDDIFAGQGISRSLHVENNIDAQKHLLDVVAEDASRMFVFANFIDFDMLYGHRRDFRGYATCLEDTDRFLEGFIPLLNRDDILIVTADHGNDPTFRGTDHTREFTPLLVYGPDIKPGPLGIRRGFYDIAQSLAQFFQITPTPRGKSFLKIRTA